MDEQHQDDLNIRSAIKVWQDVEQVFKERPAALIFKFLYSSDALNAIACCAPLNIRAALNLRLDMPKKVVCIGDIHGNIEELKSLWSSLGEHLGTQNLAEAAVIFLGDYCDRGPDSKSVYDFLIQIKATRAEELNSGGTHFICGNHDFAFSAFIDCLPITGSAPIDLDSTKPPHYNNGFWPHNVEGGMQYQGRRWAGSGSYQVYTTFDSYGVKWSNGARLELYEELKAAVPKEHKTFLKNMKWIHVQPVPFPPGFIIAVHAGLATEKDGISQIDSLVNRDLAADVLFEQAEYKARVVPFVGRGDVWKMHPDLDGKALLVSGHHGCYHAEGDRIICDKSGGNASSWRPLEAIIFPERKVIAHCSKPKRRPKLGFLDQIGR